MSRRVALWLLVGLGLLAAAGPLAGSAGAHATLESSTPGNDEVVQQAPEQVVLTFDEGVNVADDGVKVIDPRGNDVSKGGPTQAQEDREIRQRITAEAEGTYTVSYRVLSDDGHVIDGSYLFHVGHRTGSTAAVSTEGELDPLRVLNAFGRWVALSGALLVGGVLAIVWFVDGRRPTDELAETELSVAEPDDTDGSDDTDDTDATGATSSRWGDELRTGRFLLLPGAASVLFGVGLSLLASSADLAGGSIGEGVGNLGSFVTASWPGTVAGLRVLVALVLLLAVAGTVLLRKAPWLAAICVLATLLLGSVGGHAWTSSPRWLGVTSDALHVLSAAAWVGGLAVLVLTWDGSRARAAAFSRMAVVAAPLTIATGLLNTWMQERSLTAVTDTTHGRLVLAKLVGALAMLAFGVLHRRQLRDAARWSAGKVSTYRVEAVIGVVIVALTAVLVGTPPGREVERATDPVTQVRQAGEITVNLQVDPAAAGPNQVHLYYKALDGSLASVDAAELKISTGDIAPRTVPVTPITANHGFASGVQLTTGTWKFELTIVVAGTPSTTTFQVPVS